MHVQVRLEGNNPYILLALLTVTRDPSKQQRCGGLRTPGTHARRVNGRLLQPQITTASSFLRMHLPGYVIQTLQKLPTAATSPAHTAPTQSDELHVPNGQDDLKESPLLAALMQADSALRTLTLRMHSTARSMPPGVRTGPVRQPDHSNGQVASSTTPAAVPEIAAKTGFAPASGLLAAVAESSGIETCGSVFGDTAGSVVLVDVKRQKLHTVSWGDTHVAHVTNVVGHSLNAHVQRDHQVHGTAVRSASFGNIHGAHNIVLGTSGLWCASAASYYTLLIECSASQCSRDLGEVVAAMVICSSQPKHSSTRQHIDDLSATAVIFK
jgi:hypothetical protein